MSAGNVVLVTGAGRFLGGEVAARLSADKSFERIIAVDTVAPREGNDAGGRVEFVRADIRHPLIGKVLEQARVDTVVHLGVATPRVHADDHLAGTRSLIDACERSAAVRRVVLASSSAVYGANRRDPAVFGEHTVPSAPLHGQAREAADAEQVLRSFARRRRDVCVSVLRLAELVGPLVDSWLTRYLALPVVWTSLGFDPRVQVLHEFDAVEVLVRAARRDHPGVTNVAADGAVLLSQLLRRARRVRLRVPGAAVSSLRPFMPPAGVFTEPTGYVDFGRVIDTTRLHTEFGYAPRFSTDEALRSSCEARPGLPGIAGVAVAGAQRLLTGISASTGGRR